jgi:hypothetical protein
MNSDSSAAAHPLAPLGVEEYIEQSHLFASLAGRLAENVPAQEVLASLREEVLATTRLPMAIDFLLAELRHAGMFSTAMRKLPHYFTAFQSFVIGEAEDERGRFDLRVGLQILASEASYRAGQSGRTEPTRQGLFFYQFESLCRNRLGYDRGLAAMADDAAYDERWKKWLLDLRRKVGMVDMADVVYVHSEHYLQRATADEKAAAGPPLFGEREGRIALANRRKDPLFLFAALHRQLGYPEVPRLKPADETPQLIPQLLRRVDRLETRIKLLEEEQKGGLDITKLYGRPDKLSDD